ncbi:MAG: hypothetical protein FWC47_16590 [Oscillospiraceae bacterium]|nr:hypothetical protein [Oscillospiraceae bacterium]
MFKRILRENMVINISNHESSVIERGIYYFSLTNYPNITSSELKNLLDFINYEKSYGRQTEIVCKDEATLAIINNAVDHPEIIENISIPIENEFVYHGTDIKAAKEILSCGKLLSAVKVYRKTADELAFEKRDSLWNDPADYFEYIMLCWGNCAVGDYVVLSENFSSEDDLKNGNFNPGVRFYFRYEDIIKHPGNTFDGYHPIKVKDEIVLSDYLYACIVPKQYKDELEGQISLELSDKIYYLSQKKLGILDWNKKVYNFVSEL